MGEAKKACQIFYGLVFSIYMKPKICINFDGLVKSPTSALCCISQSFNVRKVRLMITKFARFEFELFTKPSKSDFLRVHQLYGCTINALSK